MMPHAHHLTCFCICARHAHGHRYPVFIVHPIVHRSVLLRSVPLVAAPLCRSAPLRVALLRSALCSALLYYSAFRSPLRYSKIGHAAARRSEQAGSYLPRAQSLAELPALCVKEELDARRQGTTEAMHVRMHVQRRATSFRREA